MGGVEKSRKKHAARTPVGEGGREGGRGGREGGTEGCPLLRGKVGDCGIKNVQTCPKVGILYGRC